MTIYELSSQHTVHLKLMQHHVSYISIKLEKVGCSKKEEVKVGQSQGHSLALGLL